MSRDKVAYKVVQFGAVSNNIVQLHTTLVGTILCFTKALDKFIHCDRLANMLKYMSQLVTEYMSQQKL